jgi:tetratricopeptide (TPR) repeat protein
MADFDQALKLNPHDPAVLVSRAKLALQGGDKLRAVADLDAASAIATKQADLRSEMGPLYEASELPDRAIAQYDLWITWHEVDARIPEALSSRCRARAVAGLDLDLALKDCNSALGRTGKSSSLSASIYGARGLVLLRMGNYDKSLSDYEAALKINPRDPWSLYGRGIDKLRKQRQSDGQADITQAKAMLPKVAEVFSSHGINP